MKPKGPSRPAPSDIRVGDRYKVHGGGRGNTIRVVEYEPPGARNHHMPGGRVVVNFYLRDGRYTVTRQWAGDYFCVRVGARIEESRYGETVRTAGIDGAE